MDKVTDQVRAVYWTRILNECMNRGISKTAYSAGQTESLKSSSFTGYASCTGKLLKLPEIRNYL